MRFECHIFTELNDQSGACKDSVSLSVVACSDGHHFYSASECPSVYLSVTD